VADVEKKVDDQSVADTDETSKVEQQDEMSDADLGGVAGAGGGLKNYNT
jgi:hypothetical protein